MKKDKGMTLVALVVTIIIMLILAGIAIKAFIGDHGLFSRTKNATEKYKEAEGNEINGIERMTDIAFDERPYFEDDGNVQEVELTAITIRVLAKDNDISDKLTYIINLGESEEFGKTYTAEKVQGEEVIFRIQGLAKGKKYYWQAVVTDGKSGEVKGNMHSKETNNNNLPVFEDDGSLKEVTRDSMKIRAVAKEDDGDKIKYTLRFGESEEYVQTYIAEEKESEEEVIFEINGLRWNKTYYWQVEVTDGKEDGVKGNKHEEKTQNNNMPIFSNEGTVTSTNGTTLTINSEATDSDGDSLEYILYWGTTANMAVVDRNTTGSFARSGLSAATYYYRVDVTDGRETKIGSTTRTAKRCIESFIETKNCSTLVVGQTQPYSCGGTITNIGSYTGTGNPNASCYVCRGYCTS